MQENKNIDTKKEVSSSKDVFVLRDDIDLNDKKSTDDLNDNRLFKKYKVKDIIFIVVASVAMLITCLDMPFIASIQIFGIGMLGIAFQVSFFQAVILAKIRKPGASFISAMLLGLFHIVFAPQMILFCFLSGLLSELIGLLAFNNYKNYVSISFTSSLLVPLITGFNIAWHFMLTGYTQSMKDLYLENAQWWIPTLVIIGVFCLSILGATLGSLLMKKLYKKGVIHESV